MLDYDNKPTVYDLGVGVGSKSLTISIHNEVLANIQDLLSKPTIPLLASLRKQLQLPEFIRLGEQPLWGFGPVLGNLPSKKDNYSLVECQLPIVNKTVDFRKANWETAYATSATLNLLFSYLETLDDIEIPDNGFYQLVHAQLLTAEGMHGGSLFVTLAKTLMPWLASQPNESGSRNIGNVMKLAYEHMVGHNNIFDQSDFRVWFRQPKWVNLSVPGNACGLDPTDYYDRQGEGYRLSPHNVDSPVQQLTLLMGVAAICESARKAGY